MSKTVSTAQSYAEYLKQALQNANSFESSQLNVELENQMYLLFLQRQAKRRAESTR